MTTATIVTHRLFSIFITVMLLSTALMAQSGVKIKERVEIYKKTPALGNTNQSISNTDPNWTEQYDGKILFKVPGTLRLKLGGFCIGSPFMAGWCWESIYGCCCCSQPSPGFGTAITVEKGGSTIFQYNPKDYWIESRPRVECTNEWWDTVSVTYWMPVGEDPFNSTGSVDLGPFQAGDEVAITVGVPECTSLSYRARNKEVNCENSNYDLAYRLDHPYTEANCPGVSNSCDEGVDLPWLSVEIPDMPQYDQNCFVMSVSSNKIHPGEKVGITIEQVDCLGNLVQFPADQIFSMWMNIDAKYGKLRCSGSEGSNVFGQQPFEFIAADIIDVDSIVVDIGASLGGGMASSIKPGNDTLRLSGPLMSSKQVTEAKKDAVSKEMNSLQSQLNKETVKKGDENQQDKLSRRLEQFKARLAYRPAKTPAGKQNTLASVKQIAKTSSMQVECNPTASVTIEKKSCEDAPPCEGPITPPQITLKELKGNEVSPDPCLQPDKHGDFPAGLFRPLSIKENPVGPFDVQACFDKQAERWRFSIPSIEIKVYLDICGCNLIGYKIIDDVSMLSNSEACDALIDINGQYYYPLVVPVGGYLFRPILLAHERRHKQDYEDALNKVLPKFEKGLEKILIKCEDAGDLSDAVQKGRSQMMSPINSFLDNIYQEYLNTTSTPSYEQNTQSSIINDIIAIRKQLVIKCASGGTP
jgi:hypothetical protein